MIIEHQFFFFKCVPLTENVLRQFNIGVTGRDNLCPPSQLAVISKPSTYIIQNYQSTQFETNQKALQPISNCCRKLIL